MCESGWYFDREAAEFHWMTRTIQPCWVHDARLYKKLEPVGALLRQQLENLRKRSLLPTVVGVLPKSEWEKHLPLELEFDELFPTYMRYYDLDQRIEKTRAHKNSQLQVLNRPELPLHNNASEPVV